MNREQFMSELKGKLQGLPFDEAEAAVAFYEEYFDEAGEQYEQTAIDSLGSPSDAAAKIIGEFAIRDIEKSPKSTKKSFSVIWMIILGIFASPLALPLALAALIIVLALIIVIFSVIFVFGISGVAIGLTGIAVSICSVFLAFTNFTSAIFYIGSGLFMLGVGGELLILTVFISQKSFALLARLMGKFLLRRGVK